MRLNKAREIAAATVPDFSDMSRSALEDFIDGVTAELKGPGIPFGERLAMNEDRKAARAELARRAAPSPQRGL